MGHQGPRGVLRTVVVERSSLNCLQSRGVWVEGSIREWDNKFLWTYIYKLPGNFWNNWGTVSCGEKCAELLQQLGVGEDGKEPATFGFLMWPKLNPQADKLGRFGVYIYSTVNVEIHKMPNNRGLVKWIITHPENARQGYHSDTKCVYFLCISQPHCVHSHCYP